MEEDVKILEELIEKYRNGNVNMLDLDANKLFKRLILEEDQVQSIENLIKGYRELVERNKQCIKAGDLERAVGFLMNRNDLSNYIPKSKVKEKIEELYEDKDNKYYYMFLEQRDIEKTISILKELMEDK